MEPVLERPKKDKRRRFRTWFRSKSGRGEKATGGEAPVNEAPSTPSSAPALSRSAERAADPRQSSLTCGGACARATNPDGLKASDESTTAKRGYRDHGADTQAGAQADGANTEEGRQQWPPDGNLMVLPMDDRAGSRDAESPTRFASSTARLGLAAGHEDTATVANSIGSPLRPSVGLNTSSSVVRPPEYADALTASSPVSRVAEPPQRTKSAEARSTIASDTYPSSLAAPAPPPSPQASTPADAPPVSLFAHASHTTIHSGNFMVVGRDHHNHCAPHTSTAAQLYAAVRPVPASQPSTAASDVDNGLEGARVRD